MPRAEGRAWIGISGYDYKPWRGPFYPADLPARRWLEYASARFDSVELNGTFYSLKSPAVFERWAGETPPRGFVFAVKGGRFITHNLKLRNAERSLGNFFASGVLALGRKTGPFLWQLPATYRFDAERMDAFMRLLPRSSRAAEGVAMMHDERLRLRRGRYGGEVPVRGGGDGGLRVRAAARLARAVRERLHRRGVGRVVAQGGALAACGTRRLRLLRQRGQGARAVRRAAARGASRESLMVRPSRATEVLSLRALNRAALARQMLLARARISALEAVERLIADR
jgi:uncharacterized protein YecE (DUF72 family)